MVTWKEFFPPLTTGKSWGSHLVAWESVKRFVCTWGKSKGQMIGEGESGVGRHPTCPDFRVSSAWPPRRSVHTDSTAHGCSCPDSTSSPLPKDVITEELDQDVWGVLINTTSTALVIKGFWGSMARACPSSARSMSVRGTRRPSIYTGVYMADSTLQTCFAHGRISVDVHWIMPNQYMNEEGFLNNFFKWFRSLRHYKEDRLGKPHVLRR